MELDEMYEQMCTTPSDINEHLPVLYEYTKRCSSVLELGVKNAVSSFAFIKGLSETDSDIRTLISCDNVKITKQYTADLICEYCEEYNINYTFLQKNDLDIVIPDELQSTDITFIDTWHIYGQLRRELAKFAPITKRYIIMHDTELDKIQGETLRSRWDAQKQSLESGIPVEEITCGLGKAVDEFLENNPEWIKEYESTRNNGLTILKRSNMN